MAKRLRAAVVLSLAGLLLGLAATPPFQALIALPYRVRLTPGEQRQLAPSLPLPLYVRADGQEGLRVNGRRLSGDRWWATGRGGLAVEAPRIGHYLLELRAFGFLPVRRVSVDVVQPLSVAVGGQSIGVVVDPDGVLVVDDAPVVDAQGRRWYPARDAGIEPGDLIVGVDGRRAPTREAVAEAVRRAGERGAAVSLTLRRGTRTFEARVRPVYDESRRRPLIGLWIRDGATGIGTLSFFDPATARFGALGHLIVDDRGRPYRFSSGEVVDAFISAVRPGRPGVPGEKVGLFVDQDGRLGTIDRNTPLGIFGRLDRLPGGGQPVEVALENEVRVGPARLVTVIRGQQPEAFDVAIERVFPRGYPSDKGMIVRVTDPRLLALTGGIVQGMSGSPILQDGRLAGVLTHVFVNDPTRGYGVFAEWMVREMVPAPGSLTRAASSGHAAAALADGSPRL